MPIHPTTLTTGVACTCLGCGASFRAYPSAVRDGRAKYCTHACYAATRRGIPKRPIEVRFWEKVRKAEGDACWEWTASRDSNGYGAFTAKPKRWKAHQFAWIMANGPIPPGLEVMHEVCDNPPCVRVSHLALGTHRRNMELMGERGRAAMTRYPELALKGSRNPRAKLTEAQIEWILEQMPDIKARVLTQRSVAAQLGVSEATISLIVNDKRWRHV
jgi:hypothetical protein